MKHNKNSRKLIQFNNKVQTSWNTLIVLVGFAFIVAIYLYTCVLEQEYIDMHTEVAYAAEEVEPKVIQIITTTEYNKEQNKEVILDKLYKCESMGHATIVGDGGDSLGWYQWQKESLEEVMQQELTDAEYHAIATSFEQSRKWAEYAYFELGQTWRWKTCTYKINNGLI
jgi:hypothetical protein